MNILKKKSNVFLPRQNKIYKKFFSRSDVNAKKRKAPPAPTNSPTPAKKTPQKRGRKRDRPNIFMTRDHFKSTPTNEVVLKSPDEVKTIQDFRMFFSEEKTRGVSFMFNEFQNKNQQMIKVPTMFFSNYWQEKPENLKNPLNDNGN